MRDYILPTCGIAYRRNEILPSRPTLVFIHGLSGSLSAWEEFEPHFERRFNIIEVDLRGHGRSRKYKKFEAYNIPNFANDLRELLLYLGVRSYVIVSHSFGAVVALELIRKNPAAVRATVFMSPIFYARSVRLARLARPFLNVLVGIWKRLPYKPAPGYHVDYSEFHDTGDWNIHRMITDIGNTTIRVYLYCLAKLYSYAGEEYLDRLAMPILIIHGRNDSVMPAIHSERLAARLKQARLVLLRNANHILVLNNTEEIARILTSFFDEHVRIETRTPTSIVYNAHDAIAK